jgi:hypothetical protein
VKKPRRKKQEWVVFPDGDPGVVYYIPAVDAFDAIKRAVEDPESGFDSAGLYVAYPARAQVIGRANVAVRNIRTVTVAEEKD